MSRASWLFLGVAVLVLGSGAGACANGTEDAGNAPDGGGAPGADATAAGNDDASGSSSDDAPSQSDDAGGGTPSDDTGAPTSDDSGGNTGDDGSTPDANEPGKDSGEEDSEAPDSGTPPFDAGHDSGSPPADAGHDSGTTAVDAGHDSGTPPVDAGQDSGTAPVDAGHDSGTTTVDAGSDGGCSAPASPVFTETFHQPETSTSCSAANVTTFYNDCFAGSGTCTSGKTSCDTCLFGSSDPTGTKWGPFLVYSVSKIDDLDLGACLYADLGATGTTSNITNCSHNLEYLLECEHAACDAPCSSASLDGYNACQTAADGSSSLCLTEYNNVFGTSAPCASVTSACFTGTDFQSAFTAVAGVMCE